MPSAGCHPSRVQRCKDENWAKRWPLMKAATGSGFMLMAAKKAELKATARTTELHFHIRKVNKMVLHYRYRCFPSFPPTHIITGRAWCRDGTWSGTADTRRF